jgi:hypothetical protein
MAAAYSAVLFVSYGQAKRMFHTEGTPFAFAEMVSIGDMESL